MTKKQIETLKDVAIVAMTNEYLNDDDKLTRFKEVLDFLRAARDLFLIDQNQVEKYSKEISAAAMDAHLEYIKGKTA